MKITAIGISGAFAPISLGNSNFLFEEDGKFMLFDCGTTAVYILRDEWGFDIGNIDAVYITHSHADHANLEHLAFYRFFVPNSTGKPVRPKLFIASSLIQPLWEHTLKGGLDGHHGRSLNLTDYFECSPIQKNKSFIWQGIKMTPFRVTHVNTGYELKPSYGLFIENPKTGKSLMITGDTCFNPDGLSYLYERADVIFHDCEVSEIRSKVHANWEDLKTLPPEIRKKTWCYHYSKVPEDIKDFAGFIKKGQEFEI